MRIAIVTTRAQRVSETFISDYVAVLRELGHEVLFFALRGTGATEWLSERVRLGDDSGSVSAPCRELLVSSFGESADSLIESFPLLCDALRDARPDIIHAHYLTPA